MSGRCPHGMLVLAVSLILFSCTDDEIALVAVGDACSADEECEGGFCFTDATFPDAYCTRLCSEDGVCPEGSVCHLYQGNYKFCMAPCKVDSDCRTGYVCDYGVCRPGCTTNGTCHAPDTCVAGRCKAACTIDADCTSGKICQDNECKAPCKTDGECGSSKRCQDGRCVPPCKTDTDCLPGFACNTQKGTCSAKAGKPMGQTCQQDSECATGYCLPARRICSIRCKGTSECPASYACGLEKLDKDKNGSSDGAEADCVPRKGTATAGALCSKDADCASEHCYYGFCMEGCAADSNCSVGKCVKVNLILDAAIPTYMGCVPTQGTSMYTLGTFPIAGTIKGLDIPPGAASFVLTAEVPGTSDIPAIVQIKDPDGSTISEVKGTCESYQVLNRYSPDAQISSLFVPNTPSVKLKPGLYTYTLSGTNGSAMATMKVQLKMGQAQKGLIHVNWVFLNLAGLPCVPSGGTLNKASAPSHAWFSKIRNNLRSILKSASLDIGTETFKDLSDAALDTIDLNSTSGSSELAKLFQTSAGVTGKAINIYLVRNIQSSMFSGGIILGIAGGIPGPPSIHGTIHSGVAMSMYTVCFEQYGYNPAHTLAHELGHFLGLSHNQESVYNPGYDEATDTVLCPCPCKANMSCYKDSSPFGQQWCRGEDHIPDSDTSSDNLMYYAAESTQLFKGNKLSNGQIRVVLDNPLVGH